jgi:hypothetical protein
MLTVLPLLAALSLSPRFTVWIDQARWATSGEVAYGTQMGSTEPADARTWPGYRFLKVGCSFFQDQGEIVKGIEDVVLETPGGIRVSGHKQDDGVYVFPAGSRWAGYPLIAYWRQDGTTPQQSGDFEVVGQTTVKPTRGSRRTAQPIIVRMGKGLSLRVLGVRPLKDDGKPGLRVAAEWLLPAKLRDAYIPWEGVILESATDARGNNLSSSRSFPDSGIEEIWSERGAVFFDLPHADPRASIKLKFRLKGRAESLRSTGNFAVARAVIAEKRIELAPTIPFQKALPQSPQNDMFASLEGPSVIPDRDAQALVVRLWMSPRAPFVGRLPGIRRAYKVLSVSAVGSQKNLRVTQLSQSVIPTEYASPPVWHMSGEGPLANETSVGAWIRFDKGVTPPPVNWTFKVQPVSQYSGIAYVSEVPVPPFGKCANVGRTIYTDGRPLMRIQRVHYVTPDTPRQLRAALNTSVPYGLAIRVKLFPRLCDVVPTVHLVSAQVPGNAWYQSPPSSMAMDCKDEGWILVNIPPRGVDRLSLRVYHEEQVAAGAPFDLNFLPPK